jgi:hypothetical protein
MGQKISEKQMKEEIRSVVRQNIKEVTTNDWHYKAIMSIWDKGGSFTRKKIAAVLCGDPKADRRDVEDALRNSGYDEVTDVTDRLRIESIITEKQLKGLDGISSNTPLDKISKDQKLKIIKAPGNIIDFIVPKGVSRNFWQVIGTGKVKKNAAGEHYLEGRVIDSPMFKSIDDLIDGVQWDSMEERRRFNEGIIKEGEDQIPGGLAKGMTLNDIADKHGMSVDMLVAEFKKGIQTEMEHTTDREMAKEITMDHLFEDPQYYTKLATVEEYVDDKGVEHVAAALPQTEEEPIKEGEDSEETLEGLKEMAMGDLERIADYANMILERMGQGQNLDSWMYSQITLAVDQLNSVHDTMDGTDGKKEEIKEEKPGLWANIRAKQARGEKPAHGNSDAHKDAVKAGKEINNEEAVNELSGNERQIKNGNPNNIFYIFYKGQFAAEYWAMNPTDLFNIYWDEFKVRRPAGSKFKLNPEFIIVPKKEYDNSTSNRYAKLKPYVDKFWDKLQNESVGVNEAKEEWAGLDTIKRGGYGSPTLRNGDKVRMVVDARKNKYYNGVINGSSIKWEDGAKSELSLSMQASNRGDLQVLRPTTKNESVNEGTEPDIIAQIKNIAKTHQNNIVVDPKSGKKMRVDAFSASAIATVYDALGDSNKEKFLASGLLGMQQMAMKLLKK